MKTDYYKILLTGVTSGHTTGTTNYQIPIYLEEKFDNMGIMSVFDGEIEQINQYSNFTYSGNNYTIIVYNTVNTNDLKTLIDAEFTIDWGDGNISGLTMPTIEMINLPSISHTYNTEITGTTIEITINSPWSVDKVKREIKLPFINDYGWYPTGNTSGSTPLGTMTYVIPYSTGTTTQDYLFDYRKQTGTTKSTTISFVGYGKSRLNEFKVYGTGNTYTIPTYTGLTDLGIYTSYNVDNLTYFDYSDGYTYITGRTTYNDNMITLNDDEILTLDNYNILFEIDEIKEIYNGMLTRDEFLIGFIDEPEIYSDIFVERGKQSLIERNLRLGEIDNMGELEIYGGGYFNVKKQ